MKKVNLRPLGAKLNKGMQATKRAVKQAANGLKKVIIHPNTKEAGRQISIIVVGALISRAIPSSNSQYIIVKQANNLSKTI